jgi:membrane protease subunit HflK
MQLRLIFSVFLVAFISIWGLKGIYIIQPAQEAAVLKFGRFTYVDSPGIHWHPPGIITVIKKDVDILNTVKLNKLILTSEENIVQASFAVQYRINNLKQYLFSTTNPEVILKQSLESATRQVIGNNRLEKILTVSRAQITNQIQEELEKLMKEYKTGILISEVIMQPAQAPAEVKNAFDDVIKAREDKERMQNEAESYANKVLPIAVGKCNRILDEARAHQEKVVFDAEGNIAGFNQLLPIYNQFPDIITSQIYYQTIESVLQKNKMYIVEGEGSKNLFFGINPSTTLSKASDKT